MMKSFESLLASWLLCYLVNSLWQLPLLFAAGWLAARALRTAGAAIEHRVWVTVLLLQSLLPACSTLPREWLQKLFAWPFHILTSDAASDAHVSVVIGPGAGFSALHIPAGLLAVVAITYVSAIIYFAARFAWRCTKLSALRREAVDLPLAFDVASRWARYAASFGIGHASIATSSRIFGPVAVGVFRKLVLLPAEMASSLPEADLDAAIAHEFAHLRRNDFLKNLIYELLSLPVCYHPLFWLTRERIMESREMVCDQIAAENSGRNEYARSLLRLASLLVQGTPVRIPHAIGIFDANAFERRIMKLTKKQNEIHGVKLLVVVAACAVFAIATCASVMALSMHVDAGSADTAHRASPEKPLNVPPGVIAGNKISGSIPKYPEAAKKARIQGIVELDAVIGNDGSIEHLEVVYGPEELQQSALDAVRDWKYKPYLLNGDPVEVKTTIKVTYTLSK